jgi:pimeloyl-ACP methyl ester carboxylesterase
MKNPLGQFPKSHATGCIPYLRSMYRIIVLLLLTTGFRHSDAQRRAVAVEADHSSGFVPFNGGALFYESQTTATGNPPPLILVHAGFQDHTMWEWQVRFFSNYFRMITFDLPGHGDTKDGPRPPDADSILLTLMDSLHLKKASVAGLSFGSAIALEFATRHPGRVEKLVMASPGIEGWDEVHSIDTSTIAAFKGMASALEAKDTMEAARCFVKSWYIGPIRKSIPKQLYDYGYACTLRNMRQHRASGWAQFASPTTVHRVTSLKVPVLILVGDKDMVEVLRVAEWLQKQLPRSKLLHFPGVAHMINLEAPARFSNVVLTFLTAKP